MTGYLLDANVFIKSKNLEYGFDFCPAFWAWLIEASQRGRVHSIEKVLEELQGGNDELSAWAVARGPEFFSPAPPTLPAALASVTGWVMTQGYEPAAVSQFLQVADYYLVAHALAIGATVVTHEVASGTKRKVKIPDVCNGLNVKHMSPYSMLRAEHARFVLGASPP
jgi:hypothetical protein